MPVNKNYLATFEPGCLYHVYSRTNNREKLYLTDEDRQRFLIQYNHYILPLFTTFAWNLLPDHFHVLIKMKSIGELIEHISSIPTIHQTKTEKEFLIKFDTNELGIMGFKRFLTSYAMSYNKLHLRRGNLFYRTFKRVEIRQDSQFTHALIYVHANAQKHRLVKDFSMHRWTSYHSCIGMQPTKLARDEVLDWFGGRDRFIKIHKYMAEYYCHSSGSIEEKESKHSVE
jgi:REP element-mobilizing transposase RayT